METVTVAGCSALRLDAAGAAIDAALMVEDDK